jgi:hypothetical protein
MAETKIKKSIGFDQMSISAKFPSGANFRFFIGRSGEKLTLAFSNDTKELDAQCKIFADWMKLRKGETNIDRFNRLEALCKRCSSGKELINIMK